MDEGGSGLTVLGTGANVGKTIFTLGLCRALRRREVSVGCFKPVCVTKGLVTAEDGALLAQEALDFSASGSAVAPVDACPVVLRPLDERVTADLFDWDYPVELVVGGRSRGVVRIRALHERAEDLGREISEGFERAAGQARNLIVEGAGCPTEGGVLGRLANQDAAELAGYPAVLLADAQSGSAVTTALGVHGDLAAGTRRLLVGLVLSRCVGTEIDRRFRDRWERETGTAVLGEVSAYGMDHDPGMAAELRRLSVSSDPLDRDRWFELVADNVEHSFEADVQELLGPAAAKTSPPLRAVR